MFVISKSVMPLPIILLCFGLDGAAFEIMSDTILPDNSYLSPSERVALRTAHFFWDAFSVTGSGDGAAMWYAPLRIYSQSGEAASPDFLLWVPGAALFCCEVKAWDFKFLTSCHVNIIDGRFVVDYAGGGHFLAFQRGSFSPNGKKNENQVEWTVRVVRNHLGSCLEGVGIQPLLIFRNLRRQEFEELGMARFFDAGMCLFSEDFLDFDSVVRRVRGMVACACAVPCCCVRKVLDEKIDVSLPSIDSLPKSGLVLTPQQERFVARGLTFGDAGHSRLRGLAGSGKTVMLCARAALLGLQGKKVLLVCYNVALSRALAEWVMYFRNDSGFLKKFKAEQSDLDNVGCVDVYHFCSAEFMEKFGLVSFDENRFGLKRKNVALASNDFPAFLKIENEVSIAYADELINAAKHRGLSSEYDAVFVDEAQDFHGRWLQFLVMMLKKGPNGANGCLVLADDPMQKMFWRDAPAVPVELRNFDVNVHSAIVRLAVGFRCPNQVLEYAKALHRGAVKGQESRYVDKYYLQAVADDVSIGDAGVFSSRDGYVLEDWTSTVKVVGDSKPFLRIAADVRSFHAGFLKKRGYVPSLCVVCLKALGTSIWDFVRDSKYGFSGPDFEGWFRSQSGVGCYVVSSRSQSQDGRRFSVPGKVMISSPAHVKGAEYDYVWIVGLERLPFHGVDTRESRAALYVAMTRGRFGCRLYWGGSNQALPDFVRETFKL
jgi:hypothetical protein